MRIGYVAAALLLMMSVPACVPSVTGDDIDREFERRLRDVDGRWEGTSSGSNVLTLNFQLQKGAGTAVSGSGTMREGSASAVPITVTGTFVRPRLSLTINGMTFEGHAVQGTYQADYTSIVLLEPLHLTGTGYTRDIQMLLSEGS
jgi:hypothetical protein